MKTSLAVTVSLLVLGSAGCDGCRQTAPSHDAAAHRDLPSPWALDVAGDAAGLDGPEDVPPDLPPPGPAHPLLGALVDAFERVGVDRFQLDLVDLRGTAHLDDRRIVFLAVELAVRALLPDMINLRGDQMGDYGGEVRVERLAALRPLRDARAFAVYRARLEVAERDLDRVPNVEGECGGEGCRERRNHNLVQCLQSTLDRARGAVSLLERLDAPPLDAGALDGSEEAPSAPSHDADVAWRWDATDVSAPSPYLAVLRAITRLVGDDAQQVGSEPLGCEGVTTVPVQDYLRRLVGEARSLRR